MTFGLVLLIVEVVVPAARRLWTRWTAGVARRSRKRSGDLGVPTKRQ
jgi:hypothetical protein